MATPKCMLRPIIALGLSGCLTIVGFTARAQQVLAPPPLDFSGISTSFITTGTNVPGALPSPVATVPEDQPLLTLGPVQLRPHLLYRFLYGDGVPAAPGDDVKTAINEFYPGILLALGDHWHLDYTPSVRFYSSSRFRDTVDHAVVLSGGTVYRDWTLGLSQSYASSSQPLIETGAQTDQETFQTALNAVYQINTPLSLELGASQSFRFLGQSIPGEQLSDSRSWSTLDWLNYQISPRIGVAFGVGFTYDDLAVGSDMTAEQLQGRITWRPGEKFFVSVSAGAEDRQYLSSNQADTINPVLGISALYRIFEPTTLSVAATRTTTPSYFASQIVENTTVSALLRQRLLTHLFLDLSGGYTRAAYDSSNANVAVNRTDDITFFNARLSLQVFKRGSVAAFYQHTEDTSSRQLFVLSSSQVGVELGYRF